MELKNNDLQLDINNNYGISVDDNIFSLSEENDSDSFSETIKDTIKTSLVKLTNKTNVEFPIKALVEDAIVETIKSSIKEAIQSPIKKRISETIGDNLFNEINGNDPQIISRESPDYNIVDSCDEFSFNTEYIDGSECTENTQTDNSSPHEENNNNNEISDKNAKSKNGNMNFFKFIYKIPKINRKKNDSIKLSKSIKYDNSKNIIIKSFKDLRPNPNGNVDYFIKSEYYNKERTGIAIVIPFFNEPNHELQQTLLSLHKGWIYLRKFSEKWRNKPLYVCLIQDGWNKADPSMKEYLKLLFPVRIRNGNTLKFWWEYYREFTCPENEYDKLEDKTFIFQKENYGPVLINPQSSFKDDPKFMRITLIIKTKNRRKHNSHEWFLGKNGFADAINAEYLFFTDAFTLFSKTCLYHLATSLDTNKKLVAVTGRQRVMSKKQQGGTESIFSLGHMLRMVQLFDFESSNVLYNGAFSLNLFGIKIGGLLPVLPGPCGMHKAKNLLNDTIRNYYFDKVNSDPDETGMIQGNLNIAEDRILTYAAAIKSSIKGAYMEFNPLAVFYFEAETVLRNFMFQRRRWINGSVAGYIVLLFISFMDFVTWKTNIIRKFYIWLLLMCQFLTYVMISLAPSISISMLYTGITYLLDFYGIKLPFDTSFIAIVFWVIYFVHIFVHNRSRFNYMIIILLLGMTFATSLISFFSLFNYAFIDNRISISEIFESYNIVIYLSIYVLIGPFIVSIALSGKCHSFLFMLKSCIFYYLFLPMLVGWFASYSYSRLHDLSWGNRPSSELHVTSIQKRKETMTKFKDTNRILIIIIAAVNLGLFFVPFPIQLYLMCSFFVLAAYQLTLSLLFCLIKMFYKIGYLFKKSRAFCRKTCCCKKNEDVIDIL